MDQEKTALIVFGISGHLSSTKLLPALLFLKQKKLLPQNFKLIGIGRRDLTLDLIKHIESITPNFTYLQEDLTSELLYARLHQELISITHQIYFLATFPELYQAIIGNLGRYDLHREEGKKVKILIEKPIGYDSKSSSEIIHSLTEYFNPHQIYAIDHYLGKDSVQNILAFRFGNPIFEELLNKTYVDNIQITSAEDFGIENRGRFYDKTGALKDVGQNHILQLLTLATMDQPKSLKASDIHEARVNLLSKVRAFPGFLVLGQYQGYQKELDILPGSQTDTYFAAKLGIANQRFESVPIYIRAGKNLPIKTTEISIVFKNLPTSIFSKTTPNILTYKIQPSEGIILNIDTKKPGFFMELEQKSMHHIYNHQGDKLPDPYEKLIIDAFLGDKAFFPTLTEIEIQWRIIDELLLYRPKTQVYQPKTWGVPTNIPFLNLSS